MLRRVVGKRVCDFDERGRGGRRLLLSLQLRDSASPYDEHYVMAFVHCVDVVTNTASH